MTGDADWVAAKIRLKPLAMMSASVGIVRQMGRSEAGVRLDYHVSGGLVSGDRISGRVMPGGTDRLLIDPSGVGHVDANLIWELDSGAHIAVQYCGRIHMNRDMDNAFRTSGETEFGASYFVTQIRFDTAHPSYTWLNGVMALGSGRIARDQALEYAIYSCSNVLSPKEVSQNGL